MIIDNMSIYGTEVEFGDARINLYLILSDAQNSNTKWKSAVYHNHFYYECHLLTEGEETFELADATVTVKESQILVIPPTLEHYPFSGKRGAKELVFAMTLEKTEGERGFYSYFDDTLSVISERAISVDEQLCAKIQEFCQSLSTDDMRGFCNRKKLAYDMIYSFFDSVNRFNVSLRSKERSIVENDMSIASH